MACPYRRGLPPPTSRAKKAIVPLEMKHYFRTALFSYALTSIVFTATPPVSAGSTASLTTLRPTVTNGPEDVLPSAACLCPGPILCCSEVVDSQSELGGKVLEELGVAIEGAHLPVGVDCFVWSPYVCISSRRSFCYDIDVVLTRSMFGVKYPLAVSTLRNVSRFSSSRWGA
jgi:hypothetical protein